ARTRAADPPPRSRASSTARGPACAAIRGSASPRDAPSARPTDTAAGSRRRLGTRRHLRATGRCRRRLRRAPRAAYAPAVLDDRVHAVLERLEREDAGERERGVPTSERSRQVARTTGQFLFSLVAVQTDCEVLEIGGSRGYSTIWLAAGVRYLGGRVLSLEHDPAKVEAWHRNIEAAGLEEWAELVEGDAFQQLPRIEDGFDIVFLDAAKDDSEEP